MYTEPMAKVSCNAVLIIKDYNLLLLDYHLLGIVGLEFMGSKL